MGIFQQFPYTNFHEMNLDWLLKKMKELATLWENFQLELDEKIPEEVDKWLDEHQYLITDKEYLTPEMFGAKGDGETNDFDAFEHCIDHANTVDMPIIVPSKAYYLDGDHPIIVNTDIYCLDSDFIVGESHQGDNPLFKYSHDNEIPEVRGLPSVFFTNNSTVTEDFKNKFFVLDTGLAYGSAINQNAPNDETVKEVIYTNEYVTNVMFDTISSHSQELMSALHISPMDERGYIFEGCNIYAKNEELRSVNFMNIQRHNMLIKDIDIHVHNKYGASAVFKAEYCNGLTFENIVSFSKQSDTVATYEIGLFYSSNVYINNFKGYNKWSSIASRALKNYTLANSIANTFDCHWNAFGKFICENCTLFSDAHIGYGKGNFIVSNTTCNKVATRPDYVQTWEGEIYMNNVKTENGLHLEYPDDTSLGYSTFFNTLAVPNVKMEKCTSTTRQIYLRVPNNTYSRIPNKSLLDIDNVPFSSIDVPYSNIVFNGILRAIPFTSGTRSSLARGVNIVWDDNGVKDVALSNANFSDNQSGYVRMYGCNVAVKFNGFLNTALASWQTLFTLPAEFRPDTNIYTTASLGTATILIYIGANGVVQNTNALSTTGERFILDTSFIKTNRY